ncbi:MAG: hypothetical protein EYC69_11710 [Bacteroidetes bacterium]|nr:MAG: hypothetical protein EYC69_11710 [Bacteroidota bacterium]
MEIFTHKEIMLMIDSFNGIAVSSRIPMKLQLTGVFDEGNRLFKKWNVDKKLLRKKLNYINEEEAKIIMRTILNFWDRFDDEQITEMFMNKALQEENYEFAAEIRDGKVSPTSLQDRFKNMNRPNQHE